MDYRKTVSYGALSLAWHFIVVLVVALLISIATGPWTDPIQVSDFQKSDQGLLITDQKKSEEKPEKARFFSKENIKVSEEQRALPTPEVSQASEEQGPQSQKAVKEKNSDFLEPETMILFRPFPDLKDLMVKFPLQKETGRKTRKSQQLLLDETLPYGSENLLNAAESVYYSFYSRIYETISPIWRSKVSEVGLTRNIPPGRYNTTVDVRLDSKGNFLNVEFREYSGINEFDSAVAATWSLVKRFPNPPQGLLDKNNEAKMTWTFSVDVGQSFNLFFNPPKRVR